VHFLLPVAEGSDGMLDTELCCFCFCDSDSGYRKSPIWLHAILTGRTVISECDVRRPTATASCRFLRMWAMLLSLIFAIAGSIRPEYLSRCDRHAQGNAATFTSSTPSAISLGLPESLIAVRIHSATQPRRRW